jgi:hypothetical protein
MSSRILMATVATLALAMPAMAQDQAVPSETEQSATPQMEQTEPGLQEEGAPEGATDEAPTMTEEVPADQPADQEMAEEAPPADMEFLQVQEDAQFLADYEVIGAKVVNNMDEQVGSIADLVMDQDQKLVGVVLSVGGFLGMGAKWVAVPVEQITFPSKDEPARLLATVTEEQLTNAPDFITREAIEAEQAAAEAERQAMEQQQQLPSPTAGAQ